MSKPKHMQGCVYEICPYGQYLSAAHPCRIKCENPKEENMIQSPEPNSIIGLKGKKKWYPKYAPHIILGTTTSMFDKHDSDTQTEK